MRVFLYLYLIVFFGASQIASAQTKATLEKRREALKAEIIKLNELSSFVKKEKQSVLAQVEDLNDRIKITEDLIRVTNQEANLLTKEIDQTNTEIDTLKVQLERTKKDYAAMIVKSRRSNSQKSRIMFLLSSADFLQAYKRLKYMQQYAEYQKEQGQEIKRQTNTLVLLIEDLENQKKEKQQLLADNKKVQADLGKAKAEQEVLVKGIQEKEQVYAAEIKQKQQEIDKIDAEIDRLIWEAIARANKAKGTTKSEKFALSPEAKALAEEFASNKGKLPWPVASGRVSMRFGKQPHPIVKTATINSNGVRIDTKVNEEVRAVFGGTVSEVQQVKGSNKAVFVRHGDYLTVYNNLSKVFVKKGDVVTLKQPLGQVGLSVSTGKATVNFYIYRNTQKLNPAHWIYKM
ncbi:peptidoglycan DD-metalloendopeptidase family protein [Gangjinia marincola]|uniref:Peptidoglycan DD-metalloendopeptidase family protein n=1 Tax=Gangjinia marincola TaxID=578463 RepID=A0ABP3XU82_9FLAO